MDFKEALEKGFVKYGDFEEEHKEKKLDMYGLRDEKHRREKRIIDGKDVEQELMRFGKEKEDAAWLKEQEKRSLTMKEMKKLPPEVLDEGWEEDMSIYQKFGKVREDEELHQQDQNNQTKNKDNKPKK